MLMAMATAQCALLFTLYAVSSGHGDGHRALFTVWCCSIAFLYGGNFCLYPTATMHTFGPSHASANYGVVFTAFGMAGVVGAMLKKPLEASLGFPDLTYLMASLCLCGAVGAWLFGFLRPLVSPP